MIDIDDIERQVRRNCDISDARHAGSYSICGLALRLRDLYKWEHRMPPWEEADSPDMLEWIEAKEHRWESLLESDYRTVRVADTDYDPFDTSGINARLQGTGLFYGAGYAHGLKPSFVLAEIERNEIVRGQPVWFLGAERVRDLLTLPAFRQREAVVLREHSGRVDFWDRMSYVGKSGRPALDFALKRSGVEPDDFEQRRRRFDRLFAVMRRILVDHEIGEIRDRVFARDTWQRILASYPHTPVELAARALKDLLADTGPHGTLSRIVAANDTAGLGFFTAFFDGLRREFFPELRPAFARFTDCEDWRMIRDAAAKGFQNARRMVLRMMEIFEDGDQNQDLPGAATKIERELLGGILRRN